MFHNMMLPLRSGMCLAFNWRSHIGITPYNVGSVLWRLFSTLEVVQYIGRITSVLWGIASVLWRLFSTVGDSFSTVGDWLQYCGGCSVQWGITSVHAGGLHQYCGG